MIVLRVTKKQSSKYIFSVKAWRFFLNETSILVFGKLVIFHCI